MPKEGIFAKVIRTGWIENENEIKVVQLEKSLK
jgi:MOSC domain-containing protein YiiM